MMTPGHVTIPQLFWRTSPMCGPCWSLLAGGRPPRHRGKSRRPSRGRESQQKEEPERGLQRGIYLAWGPSGEIGGTVTASLIALDFINGRSSNVGV
jgi:hypothetical protein